MRISSLLLSLLVMNRIAVAGPPPPFAYDIQFRPGSDTEAVAWTSFGGLFTEDGGLSWQWVCLFPLDYGGRYAPDSVISPTGAVFYTSTSGLRISRDRCLFDLSPLGERFASRVAIDSDGAVLVAMSEEGDALADPPVPPDHRIYKSVDDGLNFHAGTDLGVPVDQWLSLEVAPSDPMRVYLAGSRVDSIQQTHERWLFRSDNGGQSFMPLPLSVFEVTISGEIQIAAVSPMDPDRVLAVATFWSSLGGHELYLSTDGGQAWTSVLRIDDQFNAIHFRANGEVVVGTDDARIYRSPDGESFELVPQPHPAVQSLRETSTGLLWAGISGFGSPPFDYRLMTTDLTSWTGLLRYKDLEKMDCPAGTEQHDLCSDEIPCFAEPGLPGCEQPLPPDAALPVAPDAAINPTPPDGCCNTRGDGRPSMILGMIVVAMLRRRPARKTTGHDEN